MCCPTYEHENMCALISLLQGSMFKSKKKELRKFTLIGWYDTFDSLFQLIQIEGFSQSTYQVWSRMTVGFALTWEKTWAPQRRAGKPWKQGFTNNTHTFKG